jgi:hypothetical protein
MVSGDLSEEAITKNLRVLLEEEWGPRARIDDICEIQRATIAQGRSSEKREY